MSMHDVIAELDEVFFDTELGFGDTAVIYIPQGDEQQKFETPARVNWDNEEGDNQIRGDGRTGLNHDRGRSIRHTVLIDLPNSKTIAGVKTPLVVNTNGKDRIVTKKHGSDKEVTLSVKRIVGRDVAEQTVLCSYGIEHAPQTHKNRMG